MAGGKGWSLHGAVIGLFALGAGYVVLVHGAGLYLWAQHHVNSQPRLAALPQILRGMPDGYDDIRSEFSARVAARFRSGMPESSLTAALREEGFLLGGDGDQHYANLVQKKGWCLQDCLVHWSIGWTRDARGRAEDIGAEYERIGIPFSAFGDLFDTD